MIHAIHPSPPTSIEPTRLEPDLGHFISAVSFFLSHHYYYCLFSSETHAPDSPSPAIFSSRFALWKVWEWGFLFCFLLRERRRNPGVLLTYISTHVYSQRYLRIIKSKTIYLSIIQTEYLGRQLRGLPGRAVRAINTSQSHVFK